MNLNIAVYFDLDGVLANWVKAFEAKSPIALCEFNDMPRVERNKIKEDIYSYDFFRNLELIDEGLALLNYYKEMGYDIFILSAAGDVKNEEIKKAKINWCKEFLPFIDEDRILIVDRVVNKYKAAREEYERHFLIDDREKACDAWEAAGSNFAAKLFY